METQSGDFSLANFQFHNGEVLSELNLHYTTLGEPRRDEAGLVRNALLTDSVATSSCKILGR